ncbi:hypothetical protein [Pseudoxanthomonas sp.]|uniref:hypothetical protein n=1 Tax=Pseudoxanthomonas sp. TaxID=1871049 RepID=UPI003F818320
MTRLSVLVDAIVWSRSNVGMRQVVAGTGSSKANLIHVKPDEVAGVFRRIEGID